MCSLAPEVNSSVVNVCLGLWSVWCSEGLRTRRKVGVTLETEESQSSNLSFGCITETFITGLGIHKAEKRPRKSLSSQLNP